MAAESGAAVGLGIKTGAFASLAVISVSVVAVCLGFTMVPLKPGDELRDAARRLAAGLLCSFTLGPGIAFKAIDWFPWLMTPWQKMLEGQHVLWQYLAAAAPFVAMTAVFGFWIVAAAMRFFVNRQDKDIAQIAADVRAQLKE